MRTAPVGVEWMGQLTRSWLSMDWAQDRAVVAKVRLRLAEEDEVKEEEGGRGFTSRTRRLPRSKV